MNGAVWLTFELFFSGEFGIEAILMLC